MPAQSAACCGHILLLSFAFKPSCDIFIAIACKLIFINLLAMFSGLHLWVAWRLASMPAAMTWLAAAVAIAWRSIAISRRTTALSRVPRWRFGTVAAATPIIIAAPVCIAMAAPVSAPLRSLVATSIRTALIHP